MKTDYSKISIGTKGVYKGTLFTVVGRVKLKYVYGSWNEWYISFSNGSFGWLTEILGKYVISIEYNLENEPFLLKNMSISFQEIDFDFDKIKINDICFISLIDFFVQKISTTPIDLVEGNTPQVKKDFYKNITLIKDNKVMFARNERNDRIVKFYLGEKISEYDLNLFNFLTLEEITIKNNDTKGKITGFYCPVCSSPNPKIAGITNISFCRTCNAKLDLTESNIDILEEGYKHNHHDTTLQCGSVATIDGRKYIIVGVILKEYKTVLGLQQFVEYFLYQEGGYQLFLWIIEDRKNKKWYHSTRMKNNLLKYDFNTKPGLIGRIVSAWGGFDFDISENAKFEIYETPSSPLIRKQISKVKSPYQHQEVIINKLEEIPTREIMKFFNISRGHLVTQDKLNIN